MNFVAFVIPLISALEILAEFIYIVHILICFMEVFTKIIFHRILYKILLLFKANSIHRNKAHKILKLFSNVTGN